MSVHRTLSHAWDGVSWIARRSKLLTAAMTAISVCTCQNDADVALDEQQQARVLALAGDFPALWNDPATPMRERKRLLRLLVTDVTLTRAGNGATCCQIRFTGGQHRTLTLPRPLTATEQHTTAPATVKLIDQLLNDHPFDEIAAILDGRGITGGRGRALTVRNLAALCHARGLSTHASRLRAEVAADVGDEHARSKPSRPAWSDSSASRNSRRVRWKTAWRVFAVTMDDTTAGERLKVLRSGIAQLTARAAHRHHHRDRTGSRNGSIGRWAGHTIMRTTIL